MKTHQYSIVKYKETLKDLMKTSAYRYLKDNYQPTTKRFKIIKNENGKITSIGSLFQQNLPYKESLVYPFALLRQFILEKEKISIFRIGETIKILGTSEDYLQYQKIMKEFLKFYNSFCGVQLRTFNENGDLTVNKKLTIKELIDQLFYGDIFHRDNDKVPLEDKASWNKLIEYFLRILIFICRIGNLMSIPEIDRKFYCENCPERILSGDCYGTRSGIKKDNSVI